jgi:nucleoside-diphosphate-sugar epimerase
MVTGASGTVGSHVVRLLHEQGHDILGIDLPGSNIPLSKQIVHFNIDLSKVDQILMNSLVKNTDGIINAAAIIDISKSWQDLWPTNVNLVKKLAIASNKVNNCKLIHISSGSIYDRAYTPIKESWRIRTKNPYEASKLKSEQVIKKTSSLWSILRPALIYGPRAKFLGATLATIPPILDFVPGKKIGFYGGPITNWVHGEDVARATIHCLECYDTDNSIFNVADDTPTPFGDTLSDYMEGYGLELLTKFPIPPATYLKIFKFFIDRNITFKLINYPLKNIWNFILKYNNLSDNLIAKVDKEMSPFIFQNTIFDNSSLKDTGFKYKWPDHKNAIPSTLAWYRKNKWIPSKR